LARAQPRSPHVPRPSTPYGTATRPVLTEILNTPRTVTLWASDWFSYFAVNGPLLCEPGSHITHHTGTPVCLSVCRPIPCQPLINSKTEQRIGLATTFRLAGSRPNWQIKFRSQVRGHVGGNLKIVFGAYFGENASIPIRDGRGLPDNRNIFG